MPGDHIPRVFWFLLFLVVSAITFRSPLLALLSLSWNDDRYSYVSLIPIVTFSLIFLTGKAILLNSRYCPSLGVPLLACGTLLSYGVLASKSQNLSATICGIVLIWIGGFVLLFGLRAARVASFPLGFLFLTIPIPVQLLDHLVSALQYNSAAMSGVLFKIIRVPALRQGLIISLPAGIDIEVAPQCSGIRSTTALLLATSVAGYVLLRGALSRLLLVLIIIPMVIFKNAIRIVTLSSLAVYVNPGFLFGRLHRYGGLCFSLLDLAILMPLLLQLHRSEVRRQGTRIPEC